MEDTSSVTTWSRCAPARCGAKAAICRRKVSRNGARWRGSSPGLFAKGLIDRVALPDVATGTYLRNHYLNVDRARLDEFHAALDAALRALTERFAATPSRDTAFMNVLTTATVA